MRTIVDCGGLAHVTTMLTSSHVRMVNEALVAITILAAALDGDTVHRHLHTDLVRGLERFTSVLNY